MKTMIKDNINGFLIDRNLDSLKDALMKMQNEKLRLEMGNKFYEEIIRNWTWKVRIDDFRKMFDLFFSMRG